MMIPLIKDRYDPTVYSTICAGYAFDPFASMLNHSCTASNASWYFDGRTLRIIATCTIPANTEILLSYSGEVLSPSKRKTELLSYWGINCSCRFCTGDGNMSKLPAELQKSVQSLLKEVEKGKRPGFESMEKVVLRIKEDGYKMNTYAMLILHHHLLKQYIERGKPHECLKTCVTILFHIGPNLDPPLSLSTYRPTHFCLEERRDNDENKNAKGHRSNTRAPVDFHPSFHS